MGFLSFASEPHKLLFVDFLVSSLLIDRTSAFFFFRFILISPHFCFSQWEQLFVMHFPKYFWECRMALLEIPLPQAKIFPGFLNPDPGTHQGKPGEVLFYPTHKQSPQKLLISERIIK